jgi:Fic family protein
MVKVIPFSTTQRRSYWLEKLGGLPEPMVKNKEWMELLIDDGRNTLAIEGEFDSRWNLEDILTKPNYEDNSAKIILNFFDSALFAYEMAYLQYKENNFEIRKSLILHLHSKMFRGIVRSFSQDAGTWALGERSINKSGVHTVAPHKIEEKIDELLKFINNVKMESTRKAACFHAFFENIHPFPDGNGRMGRVLLNFILIAHGLPAVAIKGLVEKDREKYYQTLEVADQETELILGGKKVWSKIQLSAFEKLENLLERPLAVAMDTVICRKFEMNEHSLIPLPEVAEKLHKNVKSFSVACSQKKYISVVRKNVAMSHSMLIQD